jgi:MFS family permease
MSDCSNHARCTSQTSRCTGRGWYLLPPIHIPRAAWQFISLIGLILVQRWISILLAMFGVFLMIGSRKFLVQIRPQGLEFGLILSPSTAIFGYVSDRSRSRTQLFIFGLIASAASTALFALVTSPIMLVIGRALQGLSSAVVAVVGMAFLADSVDKSHVPTAMGYTSFAITWAIVIGPILGGVV